MIASYVMALCQFRPEVAFDSDGRFAPEVLERNVSRYCDLIAKAAREHDAKLVAFPQFGLTGHSMKAGIDDWVEAGVTFPGPAIDRIAQAAKAAGVYVVLQGAERHPNFPGRYFLSAAVLKPDGEVGLAYRKHYTLSTRTSPIDVFDSFIEVFGEDGLFPVLDTPLGRIGLVIGAEVHWPEGIRSLALKGAEVILNPIAAVPALDYLHRPGAQSVRSVRAFENVVYLGVANLSGQVLADGAPASPPPEDLPVSQIFDFEGRVIGQAPSGIDVFALAEIDIEALRQARGRPAAHLVAEIQPAIHEDRSALPLWPKNAFSTHRVEGFEDLLRLEQEVLNRMRGDGRLIAATQP